MLDQRHHYIAIAFLTALGTHAASASAQNMQALVLGHGGTLVEQSVPKPVPAAGQVRIKVYAIGVNPADWSWAPKMADTPGPLQIPGWDVAGTIDAVGPSVTRWKVGDAVFAMVWPPGGAYAQYTVASANEVAAKPQKLSFEEAAGIPVVGVTALRTLIDMAELRKGQRVLIQGGAGGVGSAAVQIAKAQGAYVIATASANHADYLRSLGADEVIDYKTTRFEDKVKNVDVVLNTVNEEVGLRSISVVKPGGILVTIVAKLDDASGSSEKLHAMPVLPTEKCAAAKIRCVAPGNDAKKQVGEYLADIAKLVNEGKYRVNVERVFPLADAAQAWELNRRGHTGGKLIIKVEE